MLALAREVSQTADALRNGGGSTGFSARVDLSFERSDGGIKVRVNQCEGNKKKR